MTPIAWTTCEVIVEGLGGLGRGVGAQAGLEVVLQGPGAGAAAHGHAGEDDVAAVAGGLADAAGRRSPWRRA